MKMSFEWLELAGQQEVAQILGLSSARVWALRRGDPAFPKPVAHLSQGRVWVASEIREYDQGRYKQKGRPRKEESS